jgi:carboxyl-terminal processing protease
MKRFPHLRAVAAVCAALSLAASPAQAALDPGPAAPLIAQMVSRILETNHYSHHALDAKTSKELLNNYVEMYDYNHMFFDKNDMAEFQTKFGDGLAQRLKEGDVEPAFYIFERFLKRLEEREAYVRQVTAAPVDFSADEMMVIDRHEAPWPAPGPEMTDLWRKRVKYELLQERLAKTKPEEQAKTVLTRYERLRRSYSEYDSNDVLQNYLTSLTHAYDPHSDYMAAPQMENFNISMRLSLVGIGAVLRSEDGYAKIVSLVPGGPADVDKRLKPNDRIDAIAQGDGPWVEAVGMKLDRLVQMIRGEKGTVVRLRVLPADAIDPSTKVTITLTRDEIKLTDQEAKAKIITVPAASGGRNLRVGVIDLPSFYADMKSVVEPKSTTRDVEKLVTYLKKEGVDGMILDLRRNGGGSLSESVALTGLFIPEGPVVQIKDARGLIKQLRDTDEGMLYAGPLVVLTSRASASASEIAAAALQDYGRAVVVGEKSTFGKGTVQSIIELNQYLPNALRSFKPGAVKLTIQKFYRVSGGSTQHRGVIPDIRLPALADYMDITETALKHPLPYDEVEPAVHQRLDFVTAPKVKELAKLSSERTSASPEFGYVREDIERYKKQKEEKTISLNEKKRLEEKKAEEARTTARKKERAARKSAGLAFTEITLEQIDTGKPPVVSTGTLTTQNEGPEDGPAAGSAEYDKAPPAPDYVMEETVHVVSDIISQSPATYGRASTDRSQYIP